MVYQEQVMQIAQVLSGYSLGGATCCAAPWAKKIQSEMDAQRGDFIEGARKNNVEDARASMIFDKVAKFAATASTSATPRPTRWSPIRRPISGPTIRSSSRRFHDAGHGNTDKLGNFRRELERLKVPLLGPDANKSMAEFAVETTRMAARRCAMRCLPSRASAARRWRGWRPSGPRTARSRTCST